jgi:ribosome maturation protein Sdo1
MEEIIMNENITLTEEQKERNKQEARSKLINIILEKIMEEKLNARYNKN